MKTLTCKVIVAFILFFSTQIGSAQPVTIEYLLEEKQKVIEKYTFEKEATIISLKMGFNSDSIVNPTVINRIKNKSIKFVRLIYSDYRTVRSFDQPKLNEKRLVALKNIAPWLFENTSINWEFIAQSGCKNSKECGDYFHGFVIQYQEPPSKTSMKHETENISKVLKKVLKKPEPFASTSSSKYKKVKRKCRTYYLPLSKNKREAGILYSKKGILPRKKTRICDSVEIAGKPPLTYEYEVYELPVFSDSVVTNVLTRNSSWNNMVIVADVTGSMYPYTSQLLAWITLQNNNNRVKKYFFFNDGDNKADSKKQAGKTGGIYSVEAKNVDGVQSTLKKAMTSGGGGDAPENDIEALMLAMKEPSDTNEIILIADNYANMRDYEYIKNLKKPVRVILCGVRDAWLNIQYLDLAYKTGGSVHTMEDDLTDLFALKEGETVTISGRKYKISNGDFVLTR